MAEARVGIPGRHTLLAHDFAERVSPAGSVLVRQKRHRPNLARPVAFLAVLLHDTGHLPGVRDRPCDSSLPCPADETALYLGLWSSDWLARQQFLKCLPEV